MGYGGPMLLPEGPRTVWQCPEGPGTLWECPARLVATRLDLSQLVELVGTSRNFSELLWPQGLDPGSLYLKTFTPTASRLHPSCLQAVSFGFRAGGSEGWEADLACSTAEVVGGVFFPAPLFHLHS